LPVTRAVIDEALRLYPPAASLSREAIGPDRLAGHRIRAGARVVISPWLLHRHRRLWMDPDLFDPTRFLPGNRDRIDRYAYLPFGAGPRVCIGASFALQEATIILAEVLRHVRLDAVPGHMPEPVQRVTLRPRGGMPVILRHR
jgi:cytochrome P450